MNRAGPLDLKLAGLLGLKLDDARAQRHAEHLEGTWLLLACVACQLERQTGDIHSPGWYVAISVLRAYAKDNRGRDSHSAPFRPSLSNGHAEVSFE